MCRGKIIFKSTDIYISDFFTLYKTYIPTFSLKK